MSTFLFKTDGLSFKRAQLCALRQRLVMLYLDFTLLFILVMMQLGAEHFQDLITAGVSSFSGNSLHFKHSVH